MKNDKNDKKGKKNEKPKVPKNGTEKQKNAKKSNATMLQIIEHFHDDFRHEFEEENELRSQFLWAYEMSCGNVTYSCQYVDIARSTFYRWMDSGNPALFSFQEAINKIKPEERYLDLAEGVVLAHMNAGSLDAAKFVLSSAKGRKRGYHEKANKQDQELVTRAVLRIERIILQQREQSPDFEPDIKRFAELAAVDFGVDALDVEMFYRRREAAFKQAGL